MTEQLPTASELENWDVSRVTEWLQRCSFSWQVSSYFRSNGISGRRLLEMDNRDIQQLHCLNPKEKSILRECLNNCRRVNSGIQDRIRNFPFNQNSQQSRTFPVPPRPSKNTHNQWNHQPSTLPPQTKARNNQWNHQPSTLPPQTKARNNTQWDNHSATLPSNHREYHGYDYNGNNNLSPTSNQDNDSDSGDDSDEWDDKSDDDYIEPDEEREDSPPKRGMVDSIRAELERRGTFTKKHTPEFNFNQQSHHEPDLWDDDIYDTPEGNEEDQDDTYESPSDGSVSGSGGGIVGRPNQSSYHGSYNLEEQDDVYVEADDGTDPSDRTQFEDEGEPLVYEVTDNPCPPPKQDHFPPLRPVKDRYLPQPQEDLYEIADNDSPPKPARPPKNKQQPQPPDDLYEIEPQKPVRPPKGHQPPPQPISDETYEIATDQPQQPARPPKIHQVQKPQDLEETYEIANEPPKQPERPAKAFNKPIPQAPQDDDYEITERTPPVKPQRIGINPIRRQPEVFSDDTYECTDNDPPPQKTKPPKRNSLLGRWPPSQQPEESKPIKPGKLPKSLGILPLKKSFKKNVSSAQLAQPPSQLHKTIPFQPVSDETYEVPENPESPTKPTGSQPQSYAFQPAEVLQSPKEEFVPGIDEDNYELPAATKEPTVPTTRALPPRPAGKKPPPVLPADDPPANMAHNEIPSPTGRQQEGVLSLGQLQSINQKPTATFRPLPVRPGSHADQGNQVPEELQSAPYFQGNIIRKMAEEALKNYCQDGAFLIRTGKDTPFTMSLYHKGEIKHLPIPLENGKYKLGKGGTDKFNSVIDLVNHHRRQPVYILKGGSTILTQHCPVYR